MPLFVYGKGADLGTFPELLAKAGLDVREVDFARLAQRGGIAALQTQGWAVAVASTDDLDAQWLGEDDRVVAILRPPLDRASVLTAVRAAKACERSTVDR